PQPDDVVRGAGGEQLLATGDGELPDDVECPAGQREDLGRLGVVEGELGGGGQGLGAPVLLIAGEGGGRLRGVAFHDERAGADERALPFPRVVALRNYDHVVVVGGGQVGEVAVGALEVEGDGELVDLLDAGRDQHAAEGGQGVRPVCRAGLQLVGVDDVICGQRRAVVELNALPDLERPH